MERVIRRALLGAMIAAPILAAGAQVCAEQIDEEARKAQISRDLQFKSMVGNVSNQISQMTASDDGSLWAITSSGKLLHCIFEKQVQKVRCFDRDGPSSADY